jgi:serine/threonine protein kinase/tetratricopeptide (TPR) repeat protein
MRPERLERIEEIFAEAVELEPAARADYLQQACGGEAGLREEVECLLAEHDLSRGPLDVPLLKTDRPTLVFSEGQLLGDRFRIRRFIGRGGMGEVYEVEDLDLGSIVALKTLRPEYALDARLRARFRREIQLARRVTHPNVCRVFDVGRHVADGHTFVFLTMEFLEGETLGDLLRRRGHLPPQEALPLLRQMAEALAALTRANIVHRDFKPANVMLAAADDGSTRPVVMDFGLAHPASAVGNTQTMLTSAGLLMGTPTYMAPEQLAGETVGPYTDVYALALVAYEILTGHLPFEGDSAIRVMVQKLTQEPRAPSLAVPGLGPGWDELIRRSLEKDVPKRIQEPAEVLRLLAQLETLGTLPDTQPAIPAVSDAGQATSPRLPTAVLPPSGGGLRPFIKRRGVVALLSASLVLIAAALVVAANIDSVRTPLLRGMCGAFPGSTLFCQLPADKDVAILPWKVQSSSANGAALAAGLTEYLNTSFTRLHPDQANMCVHVRNDQRSEGVNLRLEGDLTVDANSVRVGVRLREAGFGEDSLTLRSFDRVVALDDDRALYEGLLVELSQAFEIKFSEAEWEAWRRAAPRSVGTFRDYLTGLGRLRAGESEEAARLFSSVVDPSRDRRFTLGFVALGDAYRHLRVSTGDAQWERKARLAYDEAIALDRDRAFPVALAGLGELELALHQVNPAIERFEEALDLNPYDFQIRTRLGSAYEAAGRLEDAERMWRRATALKPRCWLVWNSFGNLYARNSQPVLALEKLREFVALEPAHSVAHHNLAYQYLEMGRFDDAIQMAAKAVQLGQDPLAYSTLGKAYLYRGCQPDALLNLRHSVKAAEQRSMSATDSYRVVVLWRTLGEALESSGYQDEARGAFRQAAELARRSLDGSPNDARVRREYARSLARLEGRIGEAQGEIEAVLKISPHDPASLMTAAVIRELSGDRAAALGFLDESLKRGISIHEVRNIGALASLREDPQYSSFIRDLSSDPNYQQRDMTYYPASKGCPEWLEAGKGLEGYTLPGE